MGTKKYSLEPLVRVRRDRVDASARELSVTIATREAAERARLLAEAERARKALEVQREKAELAGELQRGELTVADLQREGAWATREAWDDQARAQAVRTAGIREQEAALGEARARGLVAQAEADAKVVTEHRARWVASGQKAAEQAAEEAAAEVWRRR